MFRMEHHGKLYEFDIATSEDYCSLNFLLNQGWVVYKTEVQFKEEKFWSFKSQKEFKIWHIRRDITPMKINLEIEVPGYLYHKKNIDCFKISEEIRKGLRKQGWLSK